MAGCIKNVLKVAARECVIIRRTPIYWFCMVVFPIAVVLFFTSMMNEGQPTNMPVGVVDMDRSATSRQLVRLLDAFESSKVAGSYANVNEARRAMQRDEIYAFLYIPEGTAADLMASRQPRVSFYYSMTAPTSGALLFRDLKTISTLGSASAGKAALSAKGLTDGQVNTFLQPITIDLHQINNPYTNYNYYLSTMLVPGIIMLFIFLVTAYSVGTELKFRRSKMLMRMANGNIFVAMAGKLLPQAVIWLVITYGYMAYVFGYLAFPHPGGLHSIVVLGFLMVAASQGFGVFAFGLMPSLRMSMSICSLWAVLGFSMAGGTYPVGDMDSMLQSLSWLFPLRHYYMIYQATVFNGFPIAGVWWHLTAMVAFAMLPVTVMGNIRKAMLNFVYIP